MNAYDCIVVGTGGVGSAALFHLARRGLRCLGLDQFGAAHALGSSHGATRMIRQAYFEHADYVPLLRRAYPMWEELSRLRATQLYFETGLVEIGLRDGHVVPSILKTAQQHGLEVEELTSFQLETRWPGFVVPGELRAVYERRAGYLLVEECVRAHLELAVAHGAVLQTHHKVLGWRAEGSGVLVETESGNFSSGALIITCGSWASRMLTDLKLPLHVRKKPLHWFAGQGSDYDARSGCPCFFYELPEGMFYGIPSIDSQGVKVARHSGGTPVDDPTHVNRDVDLEERASVERFVAEYLPRLSPQPTAHTVCMYTMSPDEHFIVDRHPTHEQVAFCAGLSGHGFKFAGVLGEALADLATRGATEAEIGFLSLNRPGLR